MVPFNLKVLAKFGLCSNCSQQLDECSLARARKISVCQNRETLGENAHAMNVSGNMHPRFADFSLPDSVAILFET